MEGGALSKLQHPYLLASNTRILPTALGQMRGGNGIADSYLEVYEEGQVFSLSVDPVLEASHINYILTFSFILFS
jgi:hypothetical protein